MFPGLSSRVEKDIKEIYVREKFDGDESRLSRFKIFVNDPPRRKHGVFLGASFLANLVKPESWITRKDYQEKGVKVFTSK